MKEELRREDRQRIEVLLDARLGAMPGARSAKCHGRLAGGQRQTQV